MAHDLPAATLDRALEALADYSADFDVQGFALHEQDDEGHWLTGREYLFGQPPLGG